MAASERICFNTDLFYTDEADMDTITSFMQEAVVIKDLKHPNVVELVGVVLQRSAPPYIVTPLTRNGDLGHFLKISRATSARVQVRTQAEHPGKLDGDVCQKCAWLRPFKNTASDVR